MRFSIIYGLIIIVSTIKSYGQYSSACCDTSKAKMMSTDPVYLKNQQANGTLDNSLYPSAKRVNDFDWTLGGVPGNYYIKKPNYYNPNPLVPGDLNQYIISSPFNSGSINNPLYKGRLWDYDENGVVSYYNQSKDGWELVKRDMGYLYDGTGNGTNPVVNTDAALSGVTIDYSNPSVAYLVLYNKYKSLLRVIGTISGYSSPASMDQQVQVRLSFLDDGTSQWVPSALFNHYSYDGYNQISQSLDMATSVSNVTSPGFSWGGTGSWFVADFIAGYDFCTCQNFSALNLDFYVTTTANVTLTGKYLGAEEPITSLESSGAENWLGSVAGDYTNGSKTLSPNVGVQTFNTLEDIKDKYEVELEQYNSDLEKHEKGEKFIKGIEDVLTVSVEAASIVALCLLKEDAGKQSNAHMKTTSDDSEKAAGVAEALTGMAEVVDLFSTDFNEEKPTLPFFSMGEMALGGTVEFRNSLYNSGSTILNPGSKPNWNTTNTYPEFIGEVHTGQTPIALPGYTMYNQALGSFALVNKPTMYYDKVDGVGFEYGTKTYVFNFNGNTLNYIYNPAVPVIASKSIMQAALMVNFKMPTGIASPGSGYVQLDATHWQYTSEFTKLEDISSLDLTLANIPSSASVETAYLKLAIAYVYDIDPKYPNEDLNSRMLVLTYPMNAVYDPSKVLGIPTSVYYYSNDYTDTKHYTEINTCSYQGGGAPFWDEHYYGIDPDDLEDPYPGIYTVDGTSCGIIVEGNQTVGPGSKAYLFGETVVIREVIISGECVITSASYNGSTGISTGAPKRMPYPYRLINCSTNKANTYKSGVAGFASKAGTTEPSPIVQANVLEYLSLYPNPTVDKVKVSYHTKENEEVSLFMTDMLGRRVYDVPSFISSNSSNREEIVDVKNLPEGIYLCTLQVGDYKEVKKLVVAR